MDGIQMSILELQAPLSTQPSHLLVAVCFFVVFNSQ